EIYARGATSLPADACPLAISADVTVYAVWGFDTTGTGTPDITDEEFELTYHLNGGQGGPSPNPVMVTEQPAYKLSETAPTHGQELLNGNLTDVVFAYWTLDIGTLNMFYARGDTLPADACPLAISADVTVYAVWGFDTTGTGTPDITDAEFELTYDLNGGMNGPMPNPVTVTVQPAYTLSTDEPDHADVTYNGNVTPVLFAYWTRDAGAVNKIYAYGDAIPTPAVTVTISGDLTVYAVWGYDTSGTGKPDITDDTFLLTYDLNGGTGGPVPRSALVPIQNGYMLSDTAPTRDNVMNNGVSTAVTFAGWSTVLEANILTAADVLLLTTMTDTVDIVDRDVTVYAVWVFGAPRQPGTPFGSALIVNPGDNNQEGPMTPPTTEPGTSTPPTTSAPPEEKEEILDLFVPPSRTAAVLLFLTAIGIFCLAWFFFVKKT
ncbi:MAG: hypothetical protein FWE54_05715, partial [Methanimicrococcus sp.]|nr:hypothetical protein [Methanimicrococcus sp.]